VIYLALLELTFKQSGTRMIPDKIIHPESPSQQPGELIGKLPFDGIVSLLDASTKTRTSSSYYQHSCGLCSIVVHQSRLCPVSIEAWRTNGARIFQRVNHPAPNNPL